MYARGMSVQAIHGHLEELYGIKVLPDLISTVTDAVLDKAAEWQNRPLDACCPLVFLDATRVKIRDEGFVRNKAVFIAPGILPDETREVLGLWTEQTEGAKFWPRVMNEFRARGLANVLIAVTDGLKGFPQAIEAAFPNAIVQTVERMPSTVHPIRHSLGFMPSTAPRMQTPVWRRWRLSKPAPWAQGYPAIARSGRANWDRVIPFFAFPEPARRIVYTTNVIEALNSRLLYLVLNRAAEDWKRPPREWFEARTQFAIVFGKRFKAS